MNTLLIWSRVQKVDVDITAYTRRVCTDNSRDGAINYVGLAQARPSWLHVVESLLFASYRSTYFLGVTYTSIDVMRLRH